MGTRLPTTIGDCISVTDPTALQALSIIHYGLGARVYCESLDQFFVLKSTNSGSGYPANGVTGYRWMPDATGGGGGGFAGAASYWVSPGGANSTLPGSGSEGAPFKTRSYAYNQGLTNSPNGFVIHAAHNSAWCDGTEPFVATYGLVAGQGMRLRGDGWVAPAAGAPVGWMPERPFDLVGWDAGCNFQFSDNCAQMVGGQGDPSNGRRDDPGIWISGGSTHAHLFKDIAILAVSPARVGWDYRRNEDGTAARATITSATRTIVTTDSPWHRDRRQITFGQTVYTVQFPTPWQITTMQRTSGVTTVTVLAHTFNGQDKTKVRIFSNDSHFTTGTYLLTGSPFPTFSNGTLTLKYTDPGADTALISVSGCTMSGHFCNVDDILETAGSTDANFPNAQYLITGADIDGSGAGTVTVADPFGNNGGRAGNATTANAGTYVVEIRASGAAFDRWQDCAMFSVANSTTRFNCGPALDRGGDNSFGIRVSGGVYFGTGSDDGTSFHQSNRDPLTYSALLLWGGGAGGASFTGDKIRFSVGNVYYQGNNASAGTIVARDLIQDTPLGTNVRPVVECGGRGSSYYFLENCRNADAQLGAVDVDLGGTFGQGATNLCPLVAGQTIPGAQSLLTVCLAEFAQVWGSAGPTYEAQNKLGWYGLDGRIAGKTISHAGQFGVYQGPSLTNLLAEDLTTWTATPGGSVSVTAGQSTASLDGSSANGAYLITGNIDTGELFMPVVTTPAAAAGDAFVFTAWVKSSPQGTANQIVQGGLVNLYYANPGDLFIQLTPVGGNGEWDWITAVGVVPPALVGSTSLHFKVRAGIGNTYLIYKPKLYRLPASTYSVNEAYRQARTLRDQPSYLTAGCAGTGTGIKLIGHGGLGAKPLVVGGASGQITLGSAVAKCYPFYDETGTLVGYVQPLSGTVNP